MLPVCKAVGDQIKLDKILLDFSVRIIQRKWFWSFVKFVCLFVLERQNVEILNKYLVLIMRLSFLDTSCPLIIAGSTEQIGVAVSVYTCFCKVFISSLSWDIKYPD